MIETFEDAIELLDAWYEDCKDKIYDKDSNAVNPLQEIRNMCAMALQEIERQKEMLCILSEQVPKGAYPSEKEILRSSLKMAQRIVSESIDKQLENLK